MLRVSVVEDQAGVRTGLVKAINHSEGLSCISEYANAEDAIRGIPIDKPELVLMDIGLPGKDGIECMMQIKQSVPNIKFLMFTVFDNDEKLFEALKAGAGGYVLKSDGLFGAIDAIREMGANGAPMSREIARKVLLSFQLDTNLEKLTPREKSILEQLARGLLNKEIAAKLGISLKTVKQHNYNIYRKLEVNNRTEAVNKYLGRSF